MVQPRVRACRATRTRTSRANCGARATRPTGNKIVINSGHRDFVYASQSRASQLRYIARLFVKELVLANFPGASPQELLDRVLELMLYMESNLKRTRLASCSDC